MSLNLLLSLVQIGVGLCTMALMSYTLIRMIALTAEARTARRLAVEATERAEQSAKDAAAASVRAEVIAATAASHAVLAVAAVAEVASNVAKIEAHTNGMSHRLEALAGEAGEGRGRAQEIAKQEDIAAAAAEASNAPVDGKV